MKKGYVIIITSQPFQNIKVNSLTNRENGEKERKNGHIHELAKNKTVLMPFDDPIPLWVS